MKGLISLLCKETLKIKVRRVTTKRKKKKHKGTKNRNRYFKKKNRQGI